SSPGEQQESDRKRVQGRVSRQNFGAPSAGYFVFLTSRLPESEAAPRVSRLLMLSHRSSVSPCPLFENRRDTRENRFRQLLKLLGLEEPRRWDRLACDFRGFYRLPGGCPQSTRILDFGLGGFCLTTAGELRPSEALEIELLLSSEQAAMRWLARVVHARLHPDHAWIAGVAFTHPLQPLLFP